MSFELSMHFLLILNQQRYLLLWSWQQQTDSVHYSDLMRCNVQQSCNGKKPSNKNTSLTCDVVFQLVLFFSCKAEVPLCKDSHSQERHTFLWGHNLTSFTTPLFPLTEREFHKTIDKYGHFLPGCQRVTEASCLTGREVNETKRFGSGVDDLRFDLCWRNSEEAAAGLQR